MERGKEIPRPFAVCFEASCGYGHLHDRLSKMADRVVMAHPGKLRLIFRSARKTDRVDAEKLAKLLYLDEVPAAHTPGESGRQWRELIEFRRRLVDKQTMSSEVRCEMLLDELDAKAARVRKVTKVLDGLDDRHPGVQWLRSIPGIGERMAETVMAYIDDPNRFARSNQAASYFGLVPREDSSAGLRRLGHITKQGPPTARKYLVEVAWQAVRRSPTVRARYERILQENPKRRKIALVAVARWLVRCMQAMLKTVELWREVA